MLKYIYKRVVAHNNRVIIARNPFFSAAKVVYYKLFAQVKTWIYDIIDYFTKKTRYIVFKQLFDSRIFQLYGLVGSCADTIMVNSSWTEDHINSIWQCPLRTHLVYPPCSVEHLKALPLVSDKEKVDNIRIVAVAQFRPEKNHPLMLRAMFELRSILKEEIWERVRFKGTSFHFIEEHSKIHPCYSGQIDLHWFLSRC